MTTNDVLFMITLAFFGFALAAQYRFKKIWLADLFIACALAGVGVRLYSNSPSWLIILYAWVVPLQFVRAYFMYPTRFKRLQTGQLHLSNVLIWIIFDYRTAANLKKQRKQK